MMTTGACSPSSPTWAPVTTAADLYKHGQSANVHRHFSGTLGQMSLRSCDNGGMAWIDVDGAANMRDLGGMPTEDGGQIVPHRLLRSDNLQGLTDSDVDLLLNEYGLT